MLHGLAKTGAQKNVAEIAQPDCPETMSSDPIGRHRSGTRISCVSAAPAKLPMNIGSIHGLLDHTHARAQHVASILEGISKRAGKPDLDMFHLWNVQ